MKSGPLPLLTQQQVEQARIMRNQQNMPYKKIAAFFNVSVKCIHQYVNDPYKVGC
jgi:hypothetical protein